MTEAHVPPIRRFLLRHDFLTDDDAMDKVRTLEG